MTLYLVSNAEAVPADAWPWADDSLRPLTTTGYAQATALARQLEPLPLDIVLAAPTSRCIDTVLPATVAHGLEIRTRHDLLQPGAAALAIELLHGRSHALLCADGTVIADLLVGLRPQRPGPSTDEPAPASVWVVERAPGGHQVRPLAVPPLAPFDDGRPRRRRRSGVVVGGGGRY